MSKKTVQTMTDAMGVEVPIQYVAKYDRLRDKAVRRIHARFEKARRMLEELVAASLDDIAEIQEARLAECGVGVAAKGNFSVTTFDGAIEVSIDQTYNVLLDDRVKTARDIMLGYAKKLIDKIGGSDGAALLQIVEEAFAADKAGRLSMARVLSLCRRNIQAPEWVQAKRMLTESMQTEKSRAYLRCKVRPTPQHERRQIRLDLADCWPTNADAGAEEPA